MFNELENKVAVITGSAGGIGRAIVKKLAQNKIITVGLDINKEEGEVTRKMAEKEGVDSFFYSVNLFKKDEIENVFKSIRKEIGTIEILVNNAGISHPIPFMDITEKIWEDTIKVNLTAPFICIQQVVDDMVENKYGKIVNISSRSGVVGSKGFAAYSASKFGEIGLTQCVANEFAQYNINVNAICPGIVYTPMWESQLDDYALLKGYSKENIKDDLVGKIPMKRLQTVDDIANTVLFLISNLSENITGQTIMVTGGY